MKLGPPRRFHCAAAVCAEVGGAEEEACPKCGEPLPRFVQVGTEHEFKQSMQQGAGTDLVKSGANVAAR